MPTLNNSLSSSFYNQVTVAGFKLDLKSNFPTEKVSRKTTYHKDTFKNFLVLSPKFCDNESNACSLLKYKSEQKYIQDWGEGGKEAKLLMHRKRNREEICQNGNGNFP